MTQHWTVLPGGMGAAETAAFAGSIERMGVSGCFAPQVYAPPFAPLAAAAAGTTQLALASGIAIAYTRSPFETAMAALELDSLSGGRFVLGLGTSTRTWVERFFGSPFEPPAARLREVTEIVRAVIAGLHGGAMPSGYSGRFYDLDWRELMPPLIRPVRESVPVWVAALRGGLVGAAAEFADGLIGHPMWTAAWATDRVSQWVEDGLAKAGRKRADFHVNLWQWVAIDDDRDRALADAKRTVASYASHPQYAPYYEAHGFGSVVRALHEIAAKDLDRAAARVPDEMAETFVRIGSAAKVKAEVAALERVADSLCLVPPAYSSPERLMTLAVRIAETFYPQPVSSPPSPKREALT